VSATPRDTKTEFGGRPGEDDPLQRDDLDIAYRNPSPAQRDRQSADQEGTGTERHRIVGRTGIGLSG
jgi:hypothetical protein